MICVLSRGNFVMAGAGVPPAGLVGPGAAGPNDTDAQMLRASQPARPSRRRGAARAAVADLAVWLNPFYSITTPLIGSLNYVIHQEGIMYQLTLIGDYVAAPDCPWFTAAAIYLPLGILFLVISRARPQTARTHAD